MSKKIKASDITLPDLKIDYKAVVIKTACDWHFKRKVPRLVEESNKFGNKSMHLSSTDAERPQIHSGKRSVSSTSTRKTGYPHAEERN